MKDLPTAPTRRAWALGLLLPLAATLGCAPADDAAATPEASTASTETAPETAQAPTPESTPAASYDASTARRRPGEAAPEAAATPETAASGKRYEGGLEKKTFDVSSLKIDPPTASAPNASSGAPATGILPPSAPTQKGKMILAEGAEQTHDFGNLRQGDLGTHRFDLVSDGEEPLVISGVKPSCGCTKALIHLVGAEGEDLEYTPGDPIPVGQAFYLDTEINTDGKQGPFTAQVSLIANDPRGSFNLRMVAEIEPVLKVMPAPTVYFGRITTAEAVEDTVTVSSSSGEPFMLKPRTDAMVEPLRIELEPIEPGDDGRASQWNLKVALGPDIPIGMRNYPVRFDSDIVVPHPKYPSADGSAQYYSVQLNVQAQVTGMVSAEPGFLSFGMVNAGTPVERALMLEVHDDFKLTADIPVVVKGMQGQDFPFGEAFKTTLTPLDDGKRAELRIKLDGIPEDALGSFGGSLEIQVGHPFMSSLTVRFSGISRPASTSGGR